MRYDKVHEDGYEKKVTESYVVEALSFGEAEKTAIDFLGSYGSGESLGALGYPGTGRVVVGRAGGGGGEGDPDEARPVADPAPRRAEPRRPALSP